MREELREYYENELTYLRRMGGEFARRYPGIASRLTLSADACVDPHVERLLEGVAFMAARVHRRLDDDFPLLSESLLNLLYPTFLRPVPSMTIVECVPDPALGKKTAGMVIPKGTQLVSRPLDRVQVTFRTAYDVDLWPFRVAEAEWRLPEQLPRQPRATDGQQASAALRLRLKCLPDVSFAGLPMRRLRIFLAGDSPVVYTLHELLASKCIEIQIHEIAGERRTIVLEPSRLKPVGFTPEDDLLPYDRRSMDGHRLLQEYFALPEKFLFFDLEGVDELANTDFGSEVDIVMLFSRFERPERHQTLERNVNESTFRLSCTPAINLFPKVAEPIHLSQRKSAYPVIPDARAAEAIEVYSIDEVVGTNVRMGENTRLDPIFGYRYQTRTDNKLVFWSATRERDQLGEVKPSEILLSLVDINQQLTDPRFESLTVRTTCTNFDLPSRMPVLSPEGDFRAPTFPAAKLITCLRKPTESYPSPSGQGQVWRLISMLSLNYLSLSEEGKGALQEILRLHNFTQSMSIENQVGAIKDLRVKPHFAMVDSEYGLVPARGSAIEMELDEQRFAGGSAYLFSAVLEQFFAGYASVNSFAQTTARSNLRKEPLEAWRPRSGRQTLL